MTEKLLVTGGSGFMGGHFLELVQQDSRYDIRPFFGNLTNEGDCVRNLRDVDTVVHFAGLTYLPPSWDSPNAYMDVNYGGTLNLLNQHEMFKRFIYISTSHVYGNMPKFPIQITDKPLPDDPYAISKFAAEEAVRVYSKRFNFGSLIVRPFNNFGPRQSKHFVIPTFCLQALRDHKIVIRGNTKREFIYVRDNVRAIKAMLDNGDVGLVQVAQGITHEILHIARAIADTTGADVYIEKPYRESDIQVLLGSPESLLERLPTFKFTPIAEALKETLDFYRGLA